MRNHTHCAVLAGCLVLANSGCSSVKAGGAQAMPSVDACAEQAAGFTRDEPKVPVVICQRLHPEAPFVHLPDDQHDADGVTTIFGSLELDTRARVDGSGFEIQAARLVDRNLRSYTLVNAQGESLDEASALMVSNHLPSNRAHYLLYEAGGVLMGGSDADNARILRLERLRPIILVEGKAIDERLLGSWEGTMSKRKSQDTWFTNPQQPENFAKVRVTFEPPLLRHQNIPVLIASDPPLVDAPRYKAVGKIQNVRQGAMLSTGECAPALTGYADQNPLPNRIDPADYSIKLWRFPAMHTLWTKDFHVVLDYPQGLYPSALAMATEHNFRLKDYIAMSTQAQELVFRIHGNPIDQLVITLKPVRGGGGVCNPAESARNSLVLTSVLAEANAMVVEECPSDPGLKNTGLGRRTCESNTKGAIGNKQICFRCPLTTDQGGLNRLCDRAYSQECPHRCAFNFIESCKRGCAGEVNCENSCEDYYKKNCKAGCTAIMPTWNGDC